MEACKRQRTITGDDVTIILEIKIRDRNQPNGDPGDEEDEEAEGVADDGGGEGGEVEDENEAKMHFYKFRFPQADLVAVHSYMDLWFADKLQTSDNFQRHLSLEASGLLDFDDLVGPTLLDESSILGDRHAREIHRSLPLKFQNQSWCLAYSTRINGFSLQNLYRTVAEEKEPFLVVIQDNNKFIFGAYLTCAPRMSETFIGTGKSWMFSFGTVEFPAAAAAVAADDDEAEAAASLLPTVANAHHLNVFHWSGRNEYFYRGTTEHMIIGAGDGKFGICLDGDLHKGRIQECETFEGWPHQEMDFIISCLECWRFA